MNIIEVSNLKFGYDKNLILNDISLNIVKGSFVSLIGPNGSGKSTLLKHFNGLYNGDSGTVKVDGKEVKKYKSRDLAKKIAFVSQNTNIDYEFTVEDIVLMGRHPYKNRFEKENKHDFEIVKNALIDTNTLHLKDRLITELSGGERQRVIIAKAIAQNPEIIILDEPTSSLDINHQIEILKLLKKFNIENGTTIVLVIHDINLATRYSDEIIILKDGSILGKGNPLEVITKENIETAYTLKVAIEKSQYTDSIHLTAL